MNNITTKQTVCLYFKDTRSTFWRFHCSGSTSLTWWTTANWHESFLNSFNKPKMKKFLYNAGFSKKKIDFKNIEYLHKIKSDDFERDPQYIPMYKLLPQLTIRDNDLNKLIQHYRRMLSYRYFYIQWIFSLLFVFFWIYDIRFPVKTRRLFTAHGHKFKRHHAFLIYLLLWD